MAMDPLSIRQINTPQDPGSKIGGGLADGIGEAIDRLSAKPTGTLPNATTGEFDVIGINPNAPNHGVVHVETHGYGVDLNHNGQYDKGQDAILGMDFDKDGKIDNQEVERTNNLLSAWGGDSDFNHDGKVDKTEQLKGAFYSIQGQKYDTDHDGKLSNDELNASGTQAWVDRDKNGRIDEGETGSVDKIKTGNKLLPNDSKIFEVDPRAHTAEVRTKSPLDKLLNEGQKIKETIKDTAKKAHPKLEHKAREPKTEPK